MMNEIEQRLTDAEIMLTGLFERQNPLSIIFGGPPGFGKSHLARKLCKRFGIKWNPIRPSAKGLVEHLDGYETDLNTRQNRYRRFQQHEAEIRKICARSGQKMPSRQRLVAELGWSPRDIDPRPHPLIFDDFDDIFDDPKMMRLFKTILDSHDERVLSNEVRGPNYIAPFTVSAPAVFLTNRDFRNPAHFSPRVWKIDVPALLDRSFLVELPFDKDLVLDYTIRLAPKVLAEVKERDARGYDRLLPKAHRDEIIDHLARHHDLYREASPRTVARLGKLRLGITDTRRWQTARDTQLKPQAQPRQPTTQKSTLSQRMNDARWHGKGCNWSTPDDLYQALDEEFGFTIDVCAEGWNAKHPNHFSEQDDALKQDWGQNICWMNPPYGKVVENFVAKAYQASLHGASVVCLLPCRLNSGWWHDYVEDKAEVRTIRGRLWFTTQAGDKQQCFADAVLVIFRPPHPDAIAA